MGLGGLEPPTSSLSVTRSDQLSYNPVDFAGTTLTLPPAIHALSKLMRVDLVIEPRPSDIRGSRGFIMNRCWSNDQLRFMVELRGLEPRTPCLQSRCSSQLSYSPMDKGYSTEEAPDSQASFDVV